MTHPTNWLRPGWPTNAWMAALAAASLAFTLGFACATPLAGLGAVAALTLPARKAFALMGAVWLVNQAAGFLVLGYPTTSMSFAWGIAIGAAALLATAAGILASRVRATGPAPAIATFAAAFAVFECALYAASLAGLGGLDNYGAEIVGRILVINACAAGGLLALHALATSRMAEAITE